MSTPSTIRPYTAARLTFGLAEAVQALGLSADAHNFPDSMPVLDRLLVYCAIRIRVLSRALPELFEALDAATTEHEFSCSRLELRGHLREMEALRDVGAILDGGSPLSYAETEEDVRLADETLAFLPSSAVSDASLPA